MWGLRPHTPGAVPGRDYVTITLRIPTAGAAVTGSVRIFVGGPVIVSN
jgi:hypothetical protein